MDLEFFARFAELIVFGVKGEIEEVEDQGWFELEPESESQLMVMVSWINNPFQSWMKLKDILKEDMSQEVY